MRRSLSLVAALSLWTLGASPAWAKRVNAKAGAVGHHAAKGTKAAKAPRGRGAKAGAASTDGGAVDRSKIPDGGPAPRLEFPTPQRYALASGAQLLVVERHTLPMTVVSVIWPTGAAHDPADRAGLAGLTADLLDEGTAHHSALALASDLESIGASITAGSGWDSTGVTLTTLTRQLDPALRLLAEVVTAPAFDEAELGRKRAERLTAIAQRKDHAQALASDVFGRTLYGDEHPYGHPMFGTEAGLARIQRADLVRAFEEHLGPHDATILVVGDVQGAQIQRQLDRAFAGWRHAAPAADTTRSLPAPAPARWSLLDKPGAPQTEVRIGLPGPTRQDPDYFALLVMNGILGGEFASRLNMNLREAHGYTYGAHSAFSFRRDGGPFVIATAAKTEVSGPALFESLQELSAIRDRLPEAKELRLSKDQLERALARRFETLADVSQEIGNQVVLGLPADHLARFAANVEQVDAAAVQRVAQKHLDPAKLSVVLVGDAKALWPQVWKLGPFQAVDAEGRPSAPRPAAAPAPTPGK